MTTGIRRSLFLNYLLTGSDGLIGACVATRLAAGGHRVHAFDAKRRGPDGLPLDVRNFEQVRRAVADCDGIIHLAAVSRVMAAENDPVLCHAVNVDGTRNVCRAAAECDKRPFIIFSSSREVYGDPDNLPVKEASPLQPCNVYGRSKAEGEHLVSEVRTMGINTAILRFSNVYGTTNDHADRVVPAFARRAVRGGSIMVNGPDRLFDFTHVEDVTQAIVTAADCMSYGMRLPALHLASGIGTMLGELADLAAAASQIPLHIHRQPARNYDVSRFVGDPALANSALGWSCRISLEEGFRRLVREFAASAAGEGARA